MTVLFQSPDSGESKAVILFIVCAVLCAIGFYKFVYFLSVGYGLAIAGGGITILVMYPLVPIYHLNKKP